MAIQAFEDLTRFCLGEARGVPKPDRPRGKNVTGRPQRTLSTIETVVSENRVCVRRRLVASERWTRKHVEHGRHGA